MSYCAVQGELCSLTSHLGLQVCYIVSFCCLYSFSPWTVVSPFNRRFPESSLLCVVPLVRLSCLLHHSTGIGSIEFVPELEGKRERPVEFSSVLHVPDLHYNPLSVLYLTRNKLFSVVILETVMSFICFRAILFTAHIHALNCAYLEGTTSSNAS